jgi:parallel beta-helix repeat protein
LKAETCLKLSILFLVFFLLSVGKAKAVVTINPQGQAFTGINPNEAIYVTKSYFGSFINFNIQQINETHWNVSYEINQTFLNDVKNCWNLCSGNWLSSDCYNCWSNIKNVYFPNVDFTKLLNDAKNLTQYPMRPSLDLKFDRDSINYISQQNGSFYLIFPNGFKSWATAKMGFGTVTFTSGSQTPANLAQRDNNHPFLNASIRPYSNTSTTINCSLYVDNILNQTVNNIANNTVVYLNSSTLSTGDHTWYINCTDDNWATQTQSAIYTIGIGSNFGRCAVLIDDYGNYNLTANIINSGLSTCIQIPNNHIILDCQGHTIDGTDASGTSGIDVSRSAATTTNITIKNCVLTDWDYGFYLTYSNSNTLSNTTSNSNNYGIRLYSSNSNTLSNTTFNYNSYYGIYLRYATSSTIKNSIIQGNSQYGIYLSPAGGTSPNLIYNNLFNNTNNFYLLDTSANNWNTTRQTGTRIYSPGTEIGGNYWTNPTANGYSDTCTDANTDGFCDNAYNLTTNNLDYLPLSNKYSAADTTPPTYSLNSTNSTIAGTAVSHNLYWQDNAGLSYAIFSFDNCTGSLQNITGMTLSGTSAWSNFTVVINSTVGCTIRWCVYTNDTSNNWNGTSCQNPFSYVTTSVAQQYNYYLSDYTQFGETKEKTLTSQKAFTDYVSTSELLQKLRLVERNQALSILVNSVSTRELDVLRALFLSISIQDWYYTPYAALPPAKGGYPYPIEIENVTIEPINITIFKVFGEAQNKSLPFFVKNVGKIDATIKIMKDSPYVQEIPVFTVRVNETKLILINVSLPAELPEKDFTIILRAENYRGEKITEAYINVKIVEVPSWLVDLYTSFVSAVTGNELNKATNIYISKLTRQYYGIPFIVYVMTPTLAFLYYVTKKRETRVRGQRLGWKFSLAVIILVLLIAPVLPLPT